MLLTIVVLKLFQIKLPGGEICENHVNQNDVDAMLPVYSRQQDTTLCFKYLSTTLNIRSRRIVYYMLFTYACVCWDIAESN